MNDARKKIVETARTYLGVPFKHLGRSHAGIDCVGLVCVSARSALGAFADFIDYPPQPKTAMVYRHVRDRCDRIRADDAMEGDLVLIHRHGTSTHFGILTDRGVIHADSSLQKVVEHPLTSQYIDWQVAAHFRFRDLSELEACA